MSTTVILPSPLTRKNGLPRVCPSWCSGQHKQALEEGCSVEDAGVHLSEDLGSFLPNLSNAATGRSTLERRGGYRVQLRQGHSGGVPLVACVELDVHQPQGRDADGHTSYNRIELSLTTSEARTFAAQLLHLADAEELHRY